MRENIIIRLNEHQVIDGVQEYTAEVAVPGRYVNTIIGTSQTDLMAGLLASFEQLFTMLEIPKWVIPAPVDETPIPDLFFDEQGKLVPVSPFAATAKAKFAAEVIRNGVVVTDEEDAPETE